MKYWNAFNYIKNSSEIKEHFKKYGMNTLRIKVSSQITHADLIYFLDEVSEYELSDYNSTEKDSILHLWEREYYSKDLVMKIDSSLDRLNSDPYYDLLVFFSEIENNKLYANIEIFFIYEDLYDIIKYSRSSIVKLLFYFDENDNIKKVFINYLAR
ncbi:MAG: hypothetical protein KDC73_09310 [Ignavibacteriae bacterium]|nr:hypothetical protein [Ignavibacteriota bacterium]MCB9242092.1 hypothetical protein [Ignavibacteriales bacterium]